MKTSDLLKKVRKIEIKTKGLSSQVFSGEYQSAFKGRGMAFSEVREYQYGDDIRNIDWNVTARFNHPYVKLFEEERELTVMLLVDLSASGRFGTKKQLKQELITELCAVLAFSATTNNDKVGVIFFSDQIEKFIPPKKGRSHILGIIRELIHFEPESKGTDINVALEYFPKVVKKRSIAFLISDFLSEDFKNTLSIASRKHDIVALQVYDSAERQIPELGIIPFYDPETGATTWVNTSDKNWQKQFQIQQAKRIDKIQRIFTECGVDNTSIGTHQSYIEPLMTLFKRRGSRR